MSTRRAEDRPRLLLLPGMLCSAALWDAVLPELAQVADPRPVPLTATSIEGMVDEVLADPSPRFALAGLSLGGIVATAVARRAPHRVQGLALLSTNLRAPRPDQYAAWDELERHLPRLGPTGVTERFLLPSLVHPERVGEPALRRAVLSMAGEVGSAAFRAQLAAQRSREDYRSALAAIDCPAVVVAADRDALCPPPLMAEIVALLPGAVSAVVAECGHLAPLERAHPVAAVLRRWLGIVWQAGVGRAGRPV